MNVPERLALWQQSRDALPAWSLWPDTELKDDLLAMLHVERMGYWTLQWLATQPEGTAEAYRRPGSNAWREWLLTGPWKRFFERGTDALHSRNVSCPAYRRCDVCEAIAVVDDEPAGVSYCMACENEEVIGDVPF